MHPDDPVGDQAYVRGGQCLDVTLIIFYLQMSHFTKNFNKIKVAQNIFINNFCMYSFLIFSFVTELNALSNLFWITPRTVQ
jgi:hypothetical protein